MDPLVVDRLADLLVRFGANVQHGQRVMVAASIGQEPLARAVAASAYRQGAVFVDVRYGDPWIRRARIEHAVDDAIGYEPGWVVEMYREHGELHGASIGLSGNPAPGLLDGLDPERLGRDQPPGRAQAIENVNRGLVNWTIGPCPTPGWAATVHADLSPDDGLERLWEEVAHMCRLDEDDPVGAWQARIHQLDRAKDALNAHRFDALHLEGPGTDLTVGLLRSSIWHGGFLRTATGLVFHPNLPSEEVFTSPDPLRVDGVVTGTKPRELAGNIIRDFRVRFEGGRAVEVSATAGADVLQAWMSQDEGGSRLGEIALVDGGGRVGPLGTVFFDTLIDENAASHFALGRGFEWAVADEDAGLVNQSEIHIDLMFGSDDVRVTGITASGERVPVLTRGAWQI